jgi:hypothetical protein
VGIISVLKLPVGSLIYNDTDIEGSYKAILFEKNGIIEFYINKWAFIKKGCTPSVLEYLLNKYSANADIEYYKINDADFLPAYTQMLTMHLVPIQHLKIGVLYIKPGQNITEIFQNQPPAHSSFWTFLDLIGTKVNLQGWTKYGGDFGHVSQDTYYTTWKEIQIMFHVTPWLTTEQHRRLIGNDICLILFHTSDVVYESSDREIPFDPQVIETLGIVPQVFTVVEPVKSGYLLGFFHRANLKPYLPKPPPRGHLFTAENVMDYLFTKLYNGYVMSTKCPPVNRLFAVPRKAAIESLGEIYLKKLLKKKFLNRRISSKKNAKYMKEKSTESITKVPSGRDLASSPSKSISRVRTSECNNNNSNNEAFIVIMENNNKSRILMKKGQVLKDILEKVCSNRGIDLQDYVPKETGTGNIVPLDTPLTSIEGLCVNFVKNV